MAVAGYGTVILAHDTDVSSFLHNVSTPSSADSLNTTTFGNAGHRRRGGLRDGAVSAEGFFEGGVAGVGGSDEILNTMLGSGQPWTVGYEGLVLGTRAKLVNGLETAYEPSDAVDGVVEFSVDALSDGYGTEGGVSLHALSAETTTGFNTAVDNGAATTNGGVGHLHVTAATGSATIVIQHSVDNVTFADLITFTATAAKTSQRVEVAAGTTVNRYTRARRLAVGTTVTFAAAFARR